MAISQNLSPLWTMQDEGERYQTIVELYQEQSESADVEYLLKINCQGSGIFKINKTGIVIDWQPKGTGSTHYFQTLGLALWLELNQVLCIHANALVYNDKAIALVAPSRTGKTTLSAALCQKGFALMTDDMVALQQNDQEYIIHPSWPVARMWPDTISTLAIKNGEKFPEKNKKQDAHNQEAHNKVHEKFEKRIIALNEKNGLSFGEKPKPLKTIYFLRREDKKRRIDKNSKNQVDKHCEIVPVSYSRAVILLLQNSMLGSAYKYLGIEEKRLEAISKLITNITLKQINYTSGKTYLSDVCDKIIADTN